MRSFLLISVLGLFMSGSYVSGSQRLNTIVRNYDKKEYNAANQIWSIASTSDGLTYFANHDGLLEFDGSNWSLYKMPGDLNVRSVFVDSSDRIYVGSYEEFGFWEKDVYGKLSYKSLSKQVSEAQFHNDEIWRIIVKEKFVYFQSFSEVFVFDGTRISEIGFPGSLVLLLEADNQLYLHYLNEGLYRIEGTRAHLIAGSEQLAQRIDKLWKEVEWNWYTKGGEDVLYWHWSPYYGWEMNFPVGGYNECLIMYVLAASPPNFPIEPEVYHKGWALDGNIVTNESYMDYELILDYYEHDDSPVGPLFWAHYSYCVENPNEFKAYGEDFWGLTSSYSPRGYSGHRPDRDIGVVSLTAALASYPYTPEYSLNMIRFLYDDSRDSLRGKFGPYDAISF
jgi:hypothetical protein